MTCRSRETQIKDFDGYDEVGFSLSVVGVKYKLVTGSIYNS